MFFFLNTRKRKLIYSFKIRWKIVFRQVSSQNLYCLFCSLQGVFCVFVLQNPQRKPKRISRRQQKQPLLSYYLQLRSLVNNSERALLTIWEPAKLVKMPEWSNIEAILKQYYYSHNIVVIRVLFTKAFNTLIYFCFWKPDI